MNTRTTIMIVMIGFLMTFIGCKDKSNDPDIDQGDSTGLLSDADKAHLYDVVWYATASAGGIDLEFLSEGTFREAKSLEGTWEWQNQGDTMNIVNYANKHFDFVFDEITATIMKYRTNLGGDNFQHQIEYSTIK